MLSFSAGKETIPENSGSESLQSKKEDRAYPKRYEVLRLTWNSSLFALFIGMEILWLLELQSVRLQEGFEENRYGMYTLLPILVMLISRGTVFLKLLGDTRKARLLSAAVALGIAGLSVWIGQWVFLSPGSWGITFALDMIAIGLSLFFVGFLLFGKGYRRYLMQLSCKQWGSLIPQMRLWKRKKQRKKRKSV